MTPALADPDLFDATTTTTHDVAADGPPHDSRRVLKARKTPVGRDDAHVGASPAAPERRHVPLP